MADLRTDAHYAGYSLHVSSGMLCLRCSDFMGMYAVLSILWIVLVYRN